MATLFIVTTPLQMLTSQQIIRQEKIEDAILLESSFSNSPDFSEIYDICRIDSLWIKKLPTTVDFMGWDSGGIDIFHTAKTTRRRYKEFLAQLKNNNVKTIYLADYQCQTCRFMTIVFSHLGYFVNFYEEGYSHYVQRPFKINTGIKAKIKEWLLDYGYYLPLYGIKFAKWRNNPNMPYNGLPIHKRFSIVPGILNEPYDQQLFCVPMVSDRLKDLLENQIYVNANERRILFLSDPMSEVLYSDFRYLYFEVIKESLSDLDKDVVVYIKFHPRENKESRIQHQQLLQSLGLNFRILSNEINIPVEYYLQNTKFETIFFFNTSTFFYNGYLFPRCRFTHLLPVLLKKAIQNNAPTSNIEQMELLIEKMNKIEDMNI